MSDIFDEVDEILDEIDSTKTHETEAVEAQGFNESELSDIISEIENLEKEFESEQKMPINTSPVSVVSQLEDDYDSMDEESAEVIPFSKSTATPSSEISFEAHGQMNLNLGFKIGEETAQLTIDPVRGLCVKMNGVELVISDSDGCMVTMESGVKFTIPLTTSSSALKKKTA